MKYNGHALDADLSLLIEKEGLTIGSRYIDYADISKIRPVNHRILLTCVSGEEINISMLGFSFDGFYEELIKCFNDKSLRSLFIEEELKMLSEGEYSIPNESGRAKIALYFDSICILPPTENAVRIPLCRIDSISINKYMICIAKGGVNYTIGKMGYDTIPFYERALKACDEVKKQRKQLLSKTPLSPAFSERGLFRTLHPEHYWNAAFGNGVCALEFFTDEDTATYLYRFKETKDVFLENLKECTEAVGIHRELIYLPDERINSESLYRMSVRRSPSVRFLRERSDGRLIHNSTHSQRLQDFLKS